MNRWMGADWRILAITLFCVVLLAARLIAQQAESETPKPDAPPAAPDAKEPVKPEPKANAETENPPEPKPEAAGPEAAAYAAKLVEWKDLLKQLRRLQAEYRNADPTKAAELKKQWSDAIVKGDALLIELRETAKQAFLAAPNQDSAVKELLTRFVADDVARDDYEPAAALSQALLDAGCDDPKLYDPAGMAAFATHDFSRAIEYLQKAKAVGMLGPAGGKYLEDAGKYVEYWAQEQAIRAKEAEADDLPRVLLKTNKGDIVVELFENEAPETVGNFISLVEAKYYDGLKFHRVLPGFMAQGGCSKGDGTGDPGYKIYCECYRDDYRKHFRGTLSMAKSQARNTGGSQFFLTFLPTPHLNGLHTAFGRVIDGMDVLAKLQRVDPQDPMFKADPDKIIEAKVLRKRDHEYKPHKVE
jgi:cyclophilin family peptidyl-prolyl cis-trans isomerase